MRNLKCELKKGHIGPGDFPIKSTSSLGIVYTNIRTIPSCVFTDNHFCVRAVRVCLCTKFNMRGANTQQRTREWTILTPGMQHLQCLHLTGNRLRSDRNQSASTGGYIKYVQHTHIRSKIALSSMRARLSECVYDRLRTASTTKCQHTAAPSAFANSPSCGVARDVDVSVITAP